MHRRPIFYDTETTGTRPGRDRIIEIAAFDPNQDKRFSTFVNPECPIPPDATAISNITDEMVQEAPLIREALLAFSQFCPSDAILIAHNNEAFDQLFLEAEFQRANLSLPSWIFFDTLKWSRKYRSDLPRHSLQHLRGVYGVEANQAHRALDDALVLHQIFSRMVDDLPWETILHLMSQTPEIARMPFGKYAGKAVSEVPRDYVQWLAKTGALDKKEHRLLRETFEKLGLLTGAP